MRTVIIWDTFGEDPLSWFVVDGDKTHLNRAYIGSVHTSDDDCSELNDIVFSEEGEYIVDRSEAFDEIPREKDTKIIVCGFLP